MGKKLFVVFISLIITFGAFGFISLFGVKYEYQIGDEGEKIRVIQQRLIQYGYNFDKYGADGIFGEETQAAVMAYQSENNLVETGLVGDEMTFKLGLLLEDTPIGFINYYDYELKINNAVNKQLNPKWLNVKWSKGKWTKASQEEIKKYMNPKDYVEDSVLRYQFAVLDNNPTIKITSDNEKNIIKQLNEILEGKGVLENKGYAFVKASKETGLALPYLVSHSGLETGWGTSKLSRGISSKNKFIGYYNVYGIAAFDYDPVGQGLRKAKAEGWNSVDKAIIEGAKYLKEKTINSEKNTLYKMRWDPDSPVNNQYATDIGWAVKQCKMYKKLFEVFPDAKIEFSIPKYGNKGIAIKKEL